MDLRLQEHLAPCLLEDGETLVLERYPDGQPKQTISLADMAVRFAGCCSHAELKAMDGQQGFGRHFDRWKELGLID